MDNPIRGMFHITGLVIVQLYIPKITRVGPGSRRESTHRDRVDDDLEAIRRRHFLAAPNVSSSVPVRGSVFVIALLNLRKDGRVSHDLTPLRV